MNIAPSCSGAVFLFDGETAVSVLFALPYLVIKGMELVGNGRSIENRQSSIVNCFAQPWFRWVHRLGVAAREWGETAVAVGELAR